MTLFSLQLSAGKFATSVCVLFSSNMLFLIQWFSFDELDTSDDDKTTTSEEDTTSDSSSGNEVELDPTAALLDQEVRTGRLPWSHIFYRLNSNALKFATEIGDLTNQFKHDSSL